MRAVVSHDAGGAEVLSSFVRQHPAESLYVLAGPARGVLERKLGKLATISLDEALRDCDEVLCSTSWQSSLEYHAIASARKLDKHSIAFLDHWTNYPERFVRNGETFLPDEVLVGDVDAERIAVAAFPTLQVRLVANPYFLDIRRELDMMRSPTRDPTRGAAVLYVAEPVREHGLAQFGNERHWGYVEEEALRYFLGNVSAVAAVDRITVRPHPSEPAGKYAWAQSEFSLPIVAGGTRTLVQEIVEADVVVGCESMALVVGLLAGKRVVSCIPPGGKPCALPQREIEHLQRLVETRHNGHQS